MASALGEGYAGDVPPAQAWAFLASGGSARLIDVRTRPEWSYVGLPALASIGLEPILREWQVYPTMRVAEDFVPALGAELEAAGVPRDAPLLFLCRSGVRSRAAAIAMAASGWTACFNIAGGFEGPIDAEGHRGRIAGWKAEGLPWMQS